MSLECPGPHKCRQTVDALNMMLDSEVEAYRRLSAENAALRAQRDELVVMLSYLDRRGGLGLDVHKQIRAILAKLEVKP